MLCSNDRTTPHSTSAGARRDADGISISRLLTQNRNDAPLNISALPGMARLAGSRSHQCGIASCKGDAE